MAQGTRGRWLRVTTAGFGVLLSTSLVGCLNWDKPKDVKSTGKQPTPTPGLYGTPTLPPGGAAQGAGSFRGPGANLQQSGAFRSGNGLNTNTSGMVQPVDYRAQPGVGSQFAPPAQPGIQPSVLPPAGGSPYGSTGYSTGAPPAPSLPLDGPLPPGPPVYGSPTGTEFGSGSAPIAPPVPPPGVGAFPGAGGKGTSW